MILDWTKVRMFVKPGATDMRKQINGLSIIVSEDLHMDPFEGNLFLLCNKHRRILKILYLFYIPPEQLESLKELSMSMEDMLWEFILL